MAYIVAYATVSAVGRIGFCCQSILPQVIPRVAFQWTAGQSEGDNSVVSMDEPVPDTLRLSCKCKYTAHVGLRH